MCDPVTQEERDEYDLMIQNNHYPMVQRYVGKLRRVCKGNAKIRGG